MPLSIKNQSPQKGPVLDLERGRTDSEEVEDAKEHTPRHWQYIRSLAWCRPVATFAVLYCAALLVVITLFKQLPPLDTVTADGAAAVDGPALTFAIPHSFEELRTVRASLELYRRAYSTQVTALLAAAYLFLQSFMMPGSLAINVLAGSLYSTPAALAFVIVMSTIGASCNYLVTRWLLRDIIMGLFPSRIHSFQTELKRHQAHLLNYMLFIRLTPILPAWFVNLASPVVGVPFATFVIATSVGHLPINAITVHAGATLQTITAYHDLYSVKNVVFMMGVGLLALVPVALKRRRAGMAAVVARQQRAKQVPIIERGASLYVRS